jgi:Ni,Fe-hydrogenase I small subunit
MFIGENMLQFTEWHIEKIVISAPVCPNNDEKIVTESSFQILYDRLLKIDPFVFRSGIHNVTISAACPIPEV